MFNRVIIFRYRFRWERMNDLGNSERLRFTGERKRKRKKENGRDMRACVREWDERMGARD